MSKEKKYKDYSSPIRKLLNFFESSRDSWKVKCLEAKKVIKKLKNRIAFLEEGKTQLKNQVKDLEQRLKQSEEEIKNIQLTRKKK
jgi:uncharacterized protein YlxW (UPF0749 family)